MEKSEYKNAIENKKKMIQAFLKLSIDKEKFTVTDLVKLAGVNRGTFYLHFKSLDDVGKLIEQKLVQNFKVLEEEFRVCDISQTPEIMMERLNEIIMKDYDFYKMIIISNKSVNLMEEIRSTILNSISNNFRVMRYVTDINKFKIVVHYITGGVISIYTSWFKGIIDYNLKEITEFCKNLITSGLKGVVVYQWN